MPGSSSRSLTSSHSAALRSDRSTISGNSRSPAAPVTRGPYATLSNTVLGNGLGRWNTIPIRRRSSTGSTDGRNTDSPSKEMSPLRRVPGSSSWSRLIERRKVDFPQPDGPIIAVTALGLASTLMSNSACLAPYQNE